MTSEASRATVALIENSVLAVKEGSRIAGETADVMLESVKVLMAEDNELNREIALEFLHMGNIEADCAVNGREAEESGLFRSGRR